MKAPFCLGEGARCPVTSSCVTVGSVMAKRKVREAKSENIFEMFSMDQDILVVAGRIFVWTRLRPLYFFEKCFFCFIKGLDVRLG